ncbi:MAG: PIN/TRAM domain-containing protein [Planctomycetes bacterium]|nr:PIN/TRAM domain-containing protein [Planctomycetota bacterium]
MPLLVTRLLFILVLVAAGLAAARIVAGSDETLYQPLPFFIGAIGVALAVIGLDILIRRKSVATLSAVFFGLLAGLIMSWLLSYVISIVQIQFIQKNAEAVTLGLTVVLCYICISAIMQTKDDFRFIIPYTEFAKETKGGRPILLDTSVIIDGRIADLCETQVFDSELIVPRFVLQELQTVADSGDRLKRNRGRRGLDMLNRLQSNDKVDIRIHDGGPSTTVAGGEVDQMLVTLAQELSGRILTNDYNLNKISQLRGVSVLNINDMANALKPVFLPGESLKVAIVKAGEEPGQGVGYLEDGTMVVVEGARDMVGQEVTLSVTSVLQTSAGRMIFGRIEGQGNGGRRRPRQGGGEHDGSASREDPPA